MATGEPVVRVAVWLVADDIGAFDVCAMQSLMNFDLALLPGGGGAGRVARCSFHLAVQICIAREAANA